MNSVLKIHVLTADRNRSGNFRQLYANSVSLDDSVRFDYQKVIEVLTMLYKDQSPIIEFKLFTI